VSQSGFKVIITGMDILMKKKLQLNSGKTPDVQLFFINDLSGCPEADLLVIPDRDAVSVLRGGGAHASPVLCYGSPENMGLCLSAGCVDYLCSPWTADEFYERVRRCRRTWIIRLDDSSLILSAAGGLCLISGPDSKSVSVELTAAEQRVLKLFILNRGCYFSREMFSELLSCEADEKSRKVDMLISRIRAKITALAAESFPGVHLPAGGIIKTKSGSGWGIM
jgi:DNA-binding response OmpR family regulator